MPSFHVVSLFPDFFASPLSVGLMEKAREKGLVSVDFTDPRKFATDKHRHVDDRPYGGGPGMVMQLAPLTQALRSIKSPGRMLCMTPGGKPASQNMVRELAKEENITLVCGRYEGFDARLFDLFSLEPVCVGDMVLNGGEAAALAVIEAVARLVPGFMGKEESGEEESFSHDLLEYPQFTRPPVFEGLEVPGVLEQGNHAQIAVFRRQRSLAATLRFRPDLLCRAGLTREDAAFLRECLPSSLASRLSLALVRAAKPGQVRFAARIHDQADESVLEALQETFGLGPCFVVEGGEAPDRATVSGFGQGSVSACTCLGEAAGCLAGLHGQAPRILAVSAFPKRGETTAAEALGPLLEAGPLLLVVGREGFVEKAVLARCEGVVRPLRFCSSQRLDARVYLSLLLDRVLGDFR